AARVAAAVPSLWRQGAVGAGFVNDARLRADWRRQSGRPHIVRNVNSRRIGRPARAHRLAGAKPQASDRQRQEPADRGSNVRRSAAIFTCASAGYRAPWGAAAETLAAWKAASAHRRIVPRPVEPPGVLLGATKTGGSLCRREGEGEAERLPMVR